MTPAFKMRAHLWMALGGAVVTWLVGCTSSTISTKHPLVQGATGGTAATVYFLRPEIERRMGFPDNPVAIDLNQEQLVTLARGEYTVVKLVPREAVLTLRNLTEAGPVWAVKQMERQYTFNFKPGETYYLMVKPVDGEFRGVFFKPESVDPYVAKQAADGLHAAKVPSGAELSAAK